MLTLMTGMRERQDDDGSGLSAFMLTLKPKSEDITVNLLHYNYRYFNKYGWSTDANIYMLPDVSKRFFFSWVKQHL